MEIGMKGLGYLTLQEDGSFKGPIAKFLTEEKKQELIERLAMKVEDTLFFISDGKAVVDRLAGQIRTALGERMGLIEKDRFELCYITDFPMYEKMRKASSILRTTPSPCRRVAWRHWKR